MALGKHAAAPDGERGCAGMACAVQWRGSKKEGIMKSSFARIVGLSAVSLQLLGSLSGCELPEETVAAEPTAEAAPAEKQQALAVPCSQYLQTYVDWARQPDSTTER